VPLLYFLTLVAVLVLVHELGHFAAAKLLGVRVLRVSIGFGPKLIGMRRGETEYVLSAFPLGGYVRMLGESPRDEVHPSEATRSFSNQSLWRRWLIISGGPAMNLAFPMLLYFVVFLGDTELTPATIGAVLPEHAADGKLVAGDRVTAIDGKEITAFHELTRIVENSVGKSLRFTVERDGERIEHAITPELAHKRLPLDITREVGRIGVTPAHPAAVIGVTSPLSPAAAARLHTFDVVLAAAGRPVDRWVDLERALENNRGGSVPLTYLRPTAVPNALGGLADIDVFEPHIAMLTPDPGKGSGVSRSGLELADVYVSHVRAGSPEHRAGLLPGDRLLSLDGVPIKSWNWFVETLRAGAGRTHTIRWRRADAVHTARLALARNQRRAEHGQTVDPYVLGIRNWAPIRVDPSVPNPSPILYAVRESWRATVEMVELTIFSMVRLLQGRLSVKSIGGPLAIFEVSSTAAREGALNYLTLMAFISINLGLINLLPIPLLDGGHLVFVLLEALMRRPLAARVREYAHLVGFVLLVGLMVLAFKNDIERQWPAIRQELGLD
jgi:regulator of sigma E protease